jgi:hypothetical protein
MTRFVCPHCGGRPVVDEGVVVSHANPPDGAVPWVVCQGSNVRIGTGGLL